MARDSRSTPSRFLTRHGGTGPLLWSSWGACDSHRLFSQADFTAEGGAWWLDAEFGLSSGATLKGELESSATPERLPNTTHLQGATRQLVLAVWFARHGCPRRSLCLALCHIDGVPALSRGRLLLCSPAGLSRH